MESAPLSANMEDYLEAILALEREHQVARVKDIAQRLQVKMPSVSGALKALKARDLVQHESYGYVTLTPVGRELARHVQERHHAIVDFLGSILHLPAEQAEPEACGLEHALSPEALQRLLSLTQFLHEHPGLYQEWAEHLQRLAEGKPESIAPVIAEGSPAAGRLTLDRVPPGVTVRILRVGGAGAIRRRLLDMGLHPGTEVRVARLAPLGDPVEIHLMDYHLSLRKTEAVGIEVVVVAMPLSLVHAGETVILKDALGAGLLEHLRAAGLTVGQALTITQGLGATGGMIAQADGREVTLGRGQAQRLIVRPAAG
jgi:DtxR family transcriptional regulator, Mn-dependent transcriptional regulator